MTAICLCGYEVTPDDPQRKADESLPAGMVHADRETCLRAYYRAEGLVGVSDARIAQDVLDVDVETYGLLARASLALHDLLALSIAHGVRLEASIALRHVRLTREALMADVEDRTKGVENA